MNVTGIRNVQGGWARTRAGGARRMRAGVALLLAAALAGGCSTNGGDQALLAGRPVQVPEVSAAEVERETTTLARGEVVIYRAPVMSRVHRMDLRRGGPTVGSGMGQVDVARSGFLFAERPLGADAAAFFAVFQWDLVSGENRYTRVALADGTSVPFRTATARADPCVPNCLPISQSVIAEIPEAALRQAATSGLQLTMTLDNGHSFPVNAPAAYVAGFLAAVDGAARD